MYAGKIVEVAEVKDIFKNPMHPYTKFLINSIPRIGDKSDRLSIPGFPPSLADPPNGCRFHPRCPYAMDICREKSPLLCEVAEGHNVACFLTSEESEDGKY
jgi:peptide/nickel transport system ATP-binding protein